MSSNLSPFATIPGPRLRIAWPKRPVVFLSDLHADADALISSLIVAGVLRKKSRVHGPIKLTAFGRRAEIIIGGDCLDKGPSNLDLLRTIGKLRRKKARVVLLAGNHDLRLMMGLLSLAAPQEIASAHFFVRMGKKVVPLFKEVFEQYLQDKNWEKGIPSEDRCRALMLPNEDWFGEFEYLAAGHLTPDGIEREIGKLRNKASKFEHHCHANGLTLRQTYAAAQFAYKLFLKRKGEFSWFFRDMKLLTERGSFLFLHAGLDDALCHVLERRGVKYANKAFRKSLRANDLFRFYYSPLANAFRTKYRAADLPLTERGLNRLLKTQTRILIHGHVNRQNGQRLALKHGLLHVECDVTLDRHSRQAEGLVGPGYGYALISEKTGLLGVSSDFSKAKQLSRKSVEQLCGALYEV